MSDHNDDQLFISLDQALSHLSEYLAKFLEKELPPIFGDTWWEKGVVDKLSEQQKKKVRQNNINALLKLDIAALLRVFDKNWYSVSQKLDLLQDARNYLKEMLSTRILWAHKPAEGLAVEDIDRALDTIQRFGKVINADKKFIDEIQRSKSRIYQKETDFSLKSVSRRSMLSQEVKGKYEKVENLTITIISVVPIIKTAKSGRYLECNTEEEGLTAFWGRREGPIPRLVELQTVSLGTKYFVDLGFRRPPDKKGYYDHDLWIPESSHIKKMNKLSMD